MPPKSFYYGYIRQLSLLFVLIAIVLTYKLFRKTSTLPSTELTNSSVYASTYTDGVNSFNKITNSAKQHNPETTTAGVDPSFISPTEGPGGPILVISSAANPFSRYYAEIVRAEGLNEFAVADISAVDMHALNNYDVIILGEMTVTAAQVALFTNWVNAGGTLIVFKPQALFAPLLGIAPAKSTISDKYLLVNTAPGPGAGIVDQTIQFHGSADLHILNGATNLATLYSSASTSTNYPAITTINVGVNGGKAIAFTYDLAKSIIYTRQGNPEWAGQKRDGQIDPIRSDDLFFPDWIDFNKIAIPQADEQQRLLANIILQSNLHRKPLPRFWYLPRDLKAVIVMTGDNHTNGTTGRFYQYLTLGPNDVQDIIDWKAVRATSYIYPDRPITDEQAKFFEERGFEISLHTNTGCVDYTPLSLQKDFTEQLKRFAVSYPDLSAPITNRSHCLNWSDWSSTPKVESKNGIRLDATYYYWPESWTQNRPGMFTGSGMPMRFADLDGSLIDVYQMPTQITDETNMNYSSFCNAILDKAIGPEGYYGVFCANIHTDFKSSAGSDAIIASAQARQIPVISARQMLTWLDGRNNSFFGNITWRKDQLDFSITARNDADNLKAMLPFYSEKGQLVSISCNGNSIPFTIQTIKGIQYAFFAPATGTHTYLASYSAKRNEKKTDPAKAVSDQQIVVSKTTKESSAEKFYVNAMPNPFISYFNLIISSDDQDPVTVRILDISGNVVETHEKIPSTGVLRLGQALKRGNYFAEVIQRGQSRVIKLVKVN
jgi:hypothetical protein